MDPQVNHPFVVLGNMMWNAILIGALGFMIKWWMKSMEEKVSNYCNQNREEHGAFQKRLENHSERIAVVEDRTKDL